MIRLQEIRERKGLTQKRLSEISGVPQQTISAIESGVRRNPGILTMRCLANAMKCTIEELCPVNDAEATKGGNEQ